MSLVAFRSLKCIKIVGGWGSVPDPTRELTSYNAPQNPLAGFKWPTSKAPTSKGRKKERMGGKE